MLADTLPAVYRSAMARDKARRRVAVRAVVLAWRFDPATVRQAFDSFATRGGTRAIPVGLT